MDLFRSSNDFICSGDITGGGWSTRADAYSVHATTCVDQITSLKRRNMNNFLTIDAGLRSLKISSLRGSLDVEDFLLLGFPLPGSSKNISKLHSLSQYMFVVIECERITFDSDLQLEIKLGSEVDFKADCTNAWRTLIYCLNGIPVPY